MLDRRGTGGGNEDGRLVGRRGAAERWTRRDEEPKYAPDRTCDVEHLSLELAVDLPGRSADAVCTQTLRAAYGPFDRITLDAWDLRIRSVRDGRGRDLPYTYIDRKLTVRFPEPVAESERLVISYRVEEPVDGLFFVGPDECEPGVEWQLWSQGEDEGARHWIPCHDAPNERFTVDLRVTAESKYACIANGALVSSEERGGKRTWHYSEGVAIPSYLVSLVVGVFNRIEDRWNGIPVEYWVEPGREADGRRSFGRTPDMIEFFSRQLDCPFPYEKYAQVAVRHFHFGGMENASATTQTEGTLHDERASLDFSSDELVAHELAHQWFGDLVTCKSWTHAWLNEGFATYFEALWKEWDKGREEFDYEMVQNADAYLAEPYRRAISTPRYSFPFELFDAHLYPKAGWVLHMLRRRLGDELFWKAVRLYLNRHAPGVAETIDLMRAFEDATGRSLGCFFDQWIYSPGHPELEGELSWDGDNGWVKLAVKQTQKREGDVPVFRVPLRVEARLADGTVTGMTFELESVEQTFHLPLPSPPVWALVDPEAAVLREMKIKTPPAWAEAALLDQTHDPRVHARVDLVRQLANEAGAKATEILARVLREDPFWGVQGEAAGSLAKLRTPAALEALIAATGLEHPKARRAVMTALGQFKSPRAAKALLAVAQQGDASYFVQQQALASLGRCAGREAAEELRSQLREALDRRDWHDAIALGAVAGLASARDEGALDELLAAARDTSRYWSLRVAAIRGAAEIGAARPQLAPRIAEELFPFLDDKRILIAERTPPALVTLGHPSALGALRRKGESTPVPGTREANLKAAEELSARLRKGEEVDRLRGEAEKLREELRELRQTVEALKSKVMPKSSREGSPDGSPGGGTRRGGSAPKGARKQSRRAPAGERKDAALVRSGRPARTAAAPAAARPGRGRTKASGGGARPSKRGAGGRTGGAPRREPLVKTGKTPALKSRPSRRPRA